MKRKISLSQLRNLISESVDRYFSNLDESASSCLYHFIEPRYLVSLLRRNSFRTCNPETYYSDGEKKYVDGEGQRYISFTRNRNHKEGYPVIMLDGNGASAFDSIICRISIDGDALNRFSNFKSGQKKRHNLKVRPMDWAYYDNNRGDVFTFLDMYDVAATNGKEWMMKSDRGMYHPHWGTDGGSSEDVYGEPSDVYAHPYSQAEDRLTTDAKFIPNANKYIRCIDIYVRENEYKYSDEGDRISDKDFSYLRQISNYAQKLGIQVNFYNNQNAFTRGDIRHSVSFADIIQVHKEYYSNF